MRKALALIASALPIAMAMPGAAIAQTHGEGAIFVPGIEAAPVAAPLEITIGVTAELVILPSIATAQAQEMFGGEPVSSGELAAVSGRQQMNLLEAIVDNSSFVGNNTVGENSVTGAVNVSDSAFQNVSGIAIVNFNTGNNSSINAGMSVNLQINYASPAP